MFPLTKDTIRSARRVNLYDFLLCHHANLFQREGNSLRLKTNHSISIREGYCGYMDFSTNETGNSIDFLRRYLDYSFHDAVSLLTRVNSCMDSQRETSLKSSHPTPNLSPLAEQLNDLPVPASGFPVQAFSYLQARGIPTWVCEKLCMSNLLYMERSTRNLVFLSRRKDFYELRGTAKNSSFHCCKKVEPNRCWSFCHGTHPTHAMICEGAIDAISLFVLRLMDGTEDGCTLYCGIGGAYNQKAIERINSYMPAIIATDNDKAGEYCRKRNPSNGVMIPKHKDWNDDLCALIALPHTNHV